MAAAEEYEILLQKSLWGDDIFFVLWYIGVRLVGGAQFSF